MGDAKLIQFPRGTVILSEGEVNLDMYKILSGHAELYVDYGKPTESLLGIIGPQSCFGEFGLLLKKPAIYTVVAYDDILARRIIEGEIGDFVRENHKNILDIMRNMANSMMRMRKQIDLLITDLENTGGQSENVMRDKARLARQLMRQYAVAGCEKGNDLDALFKNIDSLI